MKIWQKHLKVDPIPSLLSSKDPALVYFVNRDLLGEPVSPIQQLWQLPGAQQTLKGQQADGSWKKTGKVKHPAVNHHLIETWKKFRFLVEMYGFNKTDPSTRKASEFIFSCQTEAGDFRGFLANQYATYYTGALLALLIKAGYEDDPRIDRGFQWLLSMRQEDQGWSIPIITHKFSGADMYRLTSQDLDPVEPDRTKPFSHNWTGMVLRAFAAHSRYRKSEAAKTAARLLKTRFFQPDCYSSYQAARYWVRFQYPFWWNNLVAALDSISLIDPTRDSQVNEAINWLIDHQKQDGLWDSSYEEGKNNNSPKSKDTRLWVSLAICRILSRLSS